jgi:hypothetical protein
LTTTRVRSAGRRLNLRSRQWCLAMNRQADATARVPGVPGPRGGSAGGVESPAAHRPVTDALARAGAPPPDRPRGESRLARSTARSARASARRRPEPGKRYAGPQVRGVAAGAAWNQAADP